MYANHPLYNPETYQNLASQMGYNSPIHKMILNKLMKDSGFNNILETTRFVESLPSLTKRAFIYKEAMEKEAIPFKKGITTLALLGSLLNPMKGMADEAMLAKATELTEKYTPQITQEVESAINNLGFFKRIGAKAYGLEDISHNLANAKANMEVMTRHGMPVDEGKSLEKSIIKLKQNIMDSGDVNLGEASNLYDNVNKFVSSSTKNIKNYLPQYITKK